jgi:hypothetical protein
MSQSTDTDATSSYSSGLEQAPARFLSRVIQHTLSNAWQTPDDFLQHFGPSAIMQSLAGADVLRAKLLVSLANVHEKIAAKKSIESAAEDLNLALEEGITTPEAVLEQYPADDRVRFLKGSQLWKFLFEDAFHKMTPSDGEAAHGRAVRRMTFLLECALDERLLTLEQLADGIGFERIADCLPMDVLRKVVVRAFEGSRRGEALTEPRFLDVVSLAKLVSYVPLEVIWTEVIVAKLAQPHGWLEAAAAPAVGTSPVTGTTEGAEGPTAPRGSKPQTQANAAEPVAEAVEPKSEVPGSNPQDEVRSRAIARLKEIDRLPPRHEDLSTPILLSIESMYEDLLEATSDEERAECIRESFPNESHLRTAMFAMAELLEPSIDVTKPPISDVDTDALVKLVVFEERKRKDGDANLRRPSVRPPPLPVGRSASSIPAARVSSPPKGGRND